MSELVLPKIDKSILDRKNEIVKKLSKLTNSENVLSESDEKDHMKLMLCQFIHKLL